MTCSRFHDELYLNKEEVNITSHLCDQTFSCRLMGQVHAKEALSPASAGGHASEDTGEIPLSEIKAKCVSVSVDGVTRTKNDVILESVSDLFKVNSFSLEASEFK